MSNGIMKFIAFMQERESIRIRKERGDPQPWTGDIVLQRRRFTNIRREHDKTCSWFRENLREPMASDPDVFWVCLIFALHVRIDAGKQLKALMPELLRTRDANVYRRHMEQHWPNGPFATPAYKITCSRDMNPLEYRTHLIEEMFSQSDHFDPMVRGLMENPKEQSLQRMHEEVKGVKGFGPFTAYEVVTDLRHTDVLRHACDINTWCNKGPGSLKGCNLIYGFDAGDEMEMEDYLLRMTSLRHKVNTKWGYGDLELRDIEHAACEFYKYCQRKKQYTTGESQWATYLEM